MKYNIPFGSVTPPMEQRRKRDRKRNRRFSNISSSSSSSDDSTYRSPVIAARSSPSYSPIPKESILYNPSDLTNHQQCDSSCFSYLKDKNELWFDFMADCGDGFHPSYEIARLLAQPYLMGTNYIKLKRADLLLIGGDLAYPGPTTDNYQRKFFRLSIMFLYVILSIQTYVMSVHIYTEYLRTVCFFLFVDYVIILDVCLVVRDCDIGGSNRCKHVECTVFMFLMWNEQYLCSNFKK